MAKKPKKSKKLTKKTRKKVLNRKIKKTSAKRRVISDKPKVANFDKIKKIKIRVIGIGGGGGSIVAEIAQAVKKASFLVANTDLKALGGLPKNVEKFHFGQELTHGLGTGMNPELGEQAAEKEKERIKKVLEGQDLVILLAALGGGVGSGATQVFARTSRNLGNMTYGIFFLPFKFEGGKKTEIAKNALIKLKPKLNAFSVLLNDKIFQVINKNIPLKKALSIINKDLAERLQSLIEIIYMPGLINIDFADFKTIFEGRGALTYLNSIRMEKGEIKEGIEKVINSPLCPYSIDGAKGVLFNISGQKNLSLVQVNQISKTISEKADKEAKIMFGISRTKEDQKFRVTLLAIGCNKKFLPEGLKKRTKPYRSIRRSTKKRKKRFPTKKETEKEGKPRISISLLRKGPKSRKFQDDAKKENDKIIRKNALAIKKEAEKEEAEMIAKEKFWETPTFLRKK